MKKSLLITSSLLLPLALTASIARFGESELSLRASASVTYDSEIRGRNLDLSDTIFREEVTLVYSRPSPTLEIAASVGLNLQQYADNSEFDDENISLDLSINPGVRMEASRFRYSVDVILNSVTRTDDAVGDIVSVRIYGLSGEVQYDPNSRLTIVTNASWRAEDPDSGTLREIDRRTVGLQLLTPIKEETRALIGFSYEKTDSDSALRNESDTVSYFIGLDGKLLPKLAGSLSLGMQQREFEDGGENDTPYIAAGLDWFINETTAAAIDVAYNSGTSLSDLTAETFSVKVDFKRELNRRWSAGLGLSYIEDTYEDRISSERNDEEWGIAGSLGYAFSDWGSLRFSLAYKDQSSNVSEFDFDRMQASLSVGGRW
jgi:hypothetical protein